MKMKVTKLLEKISKILVQIEKAFKKSSKEKVVKKKKWRRRK